MPRDKEWGHTKYCLASAMISAVQNLRDNENISDYDFRSEVQENILYVADEYLNDGIQGCICK